MHRVENVVSDSRELKEEKDHIRNALSMNGYLDWIRERADIPKPQHQVEEEVVEKLVDKEVRKRPKEDKEEIPGCNPLFRRFFGIAEKNLYKV